MRHKVQSLGLTAAPAPPPAFLVNFLIGPHSVGRAKNLSIESFPLNLRKMAVAVESLYRDKPVCLEVTGLVYRCHPSRLSQFQ